MRLTSPLPLAAIPCLCLRVLLLCAGVAGAEPRPGGADSADGADDPAAATPEQAIKGEIKSSHADLQEAWVEIRAARATLHDFLDSDARTAADGQQRRDALLADYERSKARLSSLQAERRVLVAERAQLRSRSREGLVAGGPRGDRRP